MGSRIDTPSSTSVITASTAFVDTTDYFFAFSIAQAVALG